MFQAASHRQLQQAYHILGRLHQSPPLLQHIHQIRATVPATPQLPTRLPMELTMEVMELRGE